MCQPTMYSAFLILTLFIASSASDNSFLLADEILKMQAECDFYIKQTDNAILEGSEMFPMNPGEDYFKCVDKLDNLKRQYIRENLLGLSFYPEIFPMRLSNGTLVMVSAPAEDDSSDPSTRYSDSNHLEELCSIHESCSRILDRLNESIAKEKSSEVNYFKIKRFYCLEILDKLKVKYINDNNLNVEFLKAYGELSVTCKNGKTSMPLPESLRGEDNSRELDVTSSVQSESGSSSNSKDNKDDESSSEVISYEGAYYNEVGLRIHPIVSHKEEDLVKSISPEDSLKTSQIASGNPGKTIENNEKADLPSNARIGPEASKIVKADEDEVRILESIDTVLPVPEVANTLHSSDNVHSISRSPTDKTTPVVPATHDELENTSFYMKATATDYNFLSDTVSSPAKQGDNENENSNISSGVKSNQDNNDGEKDKINVMGGIEKETSSDDDKGIINDKSDKSDSKIKISNVSFKENTDKVVESDKIVGKTDEKLFKSLEKDKISNDNLKETNDKVIKSDDSHRFEINNGEKSNYKEVNSNDNLKIDNGNINLSSETESSKTDTSGSQDAGEDMENGVVVKSDSTMDKSDENLDAYKIGNSPGKADVSKDSAENHGGEIVSNEEPDDVASVGGQNAKDPDMTPKKLKDDNTDHNVPLRSPLPDESQLNLALDHPPITTATPSPDTLGDELLDREEDCKQLLNLASKLLQYRTASYFDKEYAACVEKLNQMKIQYIKSHSVDIDKYRTLFPVTLSDGTERLVQLPPLHIESSTLPNTKSSAFPPHQPKTEQEDMFSDGDGLDDARVRHRSTNYVNRVQMDNPAFIANKKFLEYFNNQEQAGEASTLSKFANMIYRNVGRSEKKVEE